MLQYSPIFRSSFPPTLPHTDFIDNANDDDDNDANPGNQEAPHYSKPPVPPPDPWASGTPCLS